jgi:SAM-dependent methyltransferase
VSGAVSGRVNGSYDAQTLEASEDFVKYYEWLLRRIGGEIRGRTLEVGSGTGTMSDRIEHLCSQLVLVEPAANLCAILEDRFADHERVVVRHGTLESAVDGDPDLFDAKFDTVVSFNVLEHIEDDVATLQTVRRLLRPDGRLVLFVPSLPFLYGSLDEQVDHLRRYTKRSLGAAVTSAGLDLDRIEYFDFLGMMPWLVVGRVLRRTTSGGGVRMYDRIVVPVCRAFDRVIGPPLGKNLIAVAHPAR